MTSAYLEDRVDLDAGIERKAGYANSRSSMAAGVAKCGDH
jgi:hypothetical protein